MMFEYLKKNGVAQNVFINTIFRIWWILADRTNSSFFKYYAPHDVTHNGIDVSNREMFEKEPLFDGGEL